MSYAPATTRYDRMVYRRCGRSGLQLSALSLGLWHNFGADRTFDDARDMCRIAFDAGIIRFDLANNYGPPPGAAEETFGRILADDFAAHRDELIVSSKAGYRIWPGPNGEWGSRKHLSASLDQSLTRLRIDYVDIFYSHRFDSKTPLEETMAALDAAVRQGKAMYVGVSSYSSEKTAQAAKLLRELGTPAIIHQPSYSMLNRWIENTKLLNQLEKDRMGCIVFSPLAQGFLSNKYLTDIPADSRARANKTLSPDLLSKEVVHRLRALDKIARRRGQSLAQMAIAWVLRHPGVTSALIGASRPEQINDSVAALNRLDFDQEELAEIDQYAVDSGVNLWAESSAI